MRPMLNVLSDELTKTILGEAKRLLAGTGMEIRGAKMKERLLAHGMKTNRRLAL